MFISIGNISDTSFLQGIIASANGSRGESFIPFRRFLKSSEKRNIPVLIVSYFLTQSYTPPLNHRKENNFPSFTCLKNSSRRHMVQR